MYATSDFRNGLTIELDNVPYAITYFQHVKPGKGAAFVRTKLKSLLDGRVIDRTFKSGEKVGKPDIENKRMQYLYNDAEGYHFMDTNTYENLQVSADQVDAQKYYLNDGMETDILFYNGKVIGISVPNFVEMEVTESEPFAKGDTASSVNKPVKTASGMSLQVPVFINQGDWIKVDTRSGEYIERVKK